jgi:hypothetical protein
MTSAKRTDRVMCKGGSAVRRYTMTTIVEILPSAKKLYSSSSWNSRRTNPSNSEAPHVRVRLAEKFVARLIGFARSSPGRPLISRSAEQNPSDLS